MSDETKKAVGVSDNNQPPIRTREKTRWLMVFYDTVIYVLTWLVTFVIHPSSVNKLPIETCIFYLFVGYLFIFGIRFLTKGYKQILRYGSVGVFSYEILSSVIGGGLLVLIGTLLTKLYDLFSVRFVLIVSFASIYAVISITIRLLYCHLFKIAENDSAFARFVKKALEIVGLVDFSSNNPGGTLHFVLEPDLPSLSPINEVQNIVDKFAIRGDVVKITQINKGYINRTYKVETMSDTGHTHKYTLQRINTNVFPDTDALMDNFKLTTEHLRGKLILPGKRMSGCVQTLRPTKDGCSFLRDDSGCWRMLTYFDSVYSLDIPDSPETFYYAGGAFGNFMKEMSDIDAKHIKEVIPNFHNTKSRYNDLEEAIKRDPKGRVKNVMPEIEFIRARADKFSMISDALESGKIPIRICHNDCNLNNILFDKKTHLPVAIIDLDTVMPSSPLYDYGDSMRIGTNTATDDEKDLTKVSCDLNLYEKYARGYLEACGDILTKEELELLPYASLIITSEDGIRFLMDHINGDTYYNIFYPGQNLDRSRTQLKLVEDMERKLPEIKEILKKIYSELGLKADI